MQPETVLEAYKKFSESEACQKNPRLVDNLRTVLKRYILPAYGFNLEDLKRSKLEEYLAQVPLLKLLGDATQLLNDFSRRASQSSTSQSISNGTIANYRSALTRFFDWVYAQGWHDYSISSEISARAPQLASSHTLAKARRGGRNLAANPYALKEEELTDTLKQQLEELETFWTSTSVQLRQENVIEQATFNFYKFKILCILGWLKNIQGEDLKQLSLERIVNFSKLQEFVEWGIQTRQNNYGWAMNTAKATLAVSRWLSSRSKIEEGAATELQAYLQSLTQKYRQIVDERSEKLPLTFKQGVMVVEYLKQCCAPRQKSGLVRSESAIMRSWQRYLIVALLTYTPLRQREIRELKLGRSLIRDQDNYRIYLDTKSKVSKEFKLPKLLTEDLDIWVQQFLPKISPKDDLVFMRLGANNKSESLGQPLTSRDISDLVSSAIYKATSILFDEPIQTPQRILRNTTFGFLDQFSQSTALPESNLSRVTKQITGIVQPQSQRTKLPSLLDTVKTPIQAFLKPAEEVEESDEEGGPGDSATKDNEQTEQ